MLYDRHHIRSSVLRRQEAYRLHRRRWTVRYTPHTSQLDNVVVRRYDELVGMFAGKHVPSVGFSLGVERIFTILDDRLVRFVYHCVNFL